MKLHPICIRKSSFSHHKQSYVRLDINKYVTHNTYSYNHFHCAKTAVELPKSAQPGPGRHKSVRGDRNKILDTHKAQCSFNCKRPCSPFRLNFLSTCLYVCANSSPYTGSTLPYTPPNASTTVVAPHHDMFPFIKCTKLM